MQSEKIDIILLRGAPGSGKSQVAKSLCEFYPKGVRMEIDNLRSMVVSVDWTNQDEHINILHLSTKLVYDFIQLGFSPVIVVDTFSGDKVKKYIDDLYQLRKDLSIKIIGLYTTENELKKRIDTRGHGEFNDFMVCKRLNEDVLKFRYGNEYQIDTTGLLPIDIAKKIYFSDPYPK